MTPSFLSGRFALAAVAALLLVVGTGCATSVEPDQVAVEYDKGPLSSTDFDACVKSGTRAWYGPFDEVSVYPAGQRAYEFGEEKSADTGPLEVVSKDNLPMSVSGVVTFALNTDCKVLQQFHEKIGRKFEANTDSGWLKLLGTYLRQPLDRAMDTAAKNYNWKDLYSDQATKTAWEAKVGEALATQVNEVAGGPYFCGAAGADAKTCGPFTLKLQQPQPPENVRNALASAQEAKEQNEAQRNKNDRVQTELDSIKDLVKVLGPEGYVLYKAIEDGRIKVVPVPAGGSINVQE